MEASRTGDVETAKMLLDHGDDPNLANAVSSHITFRNYTELALGIT